MQEICALCGGITREICGDCESNSVQSGKLEFWWNGFLAKCVEVFYCSKCGSTWIQGMRQARRVICKPCRAKALAA